MTFDNFSFSVYLSNSEPETTKVAKIVFLAPGRLRNASTCISHPWESSEFCSHEVNMWLHKGKQWQTTLELSHVLNHFRLWQGWCL